MSYPDLDDDLFELSEEEKEAARKREAGGEVVERASNRSAADDILDAVSGSDTSGHQPNRANCPKCGGHSKTRGPGVGRGMRTRRCRKCGHEWPVGMISERAEVPPVPPLPPQLGGGGPFHGESGPPIDANQPIHRRLAEHTRRARDHEP